MYVHLKHCGTGHLVRNRKFDLDWVSYLGEDEFYSNFSIPTPQFHSVL